MPYTANAYDDTTPTGSTRAEFLDEELRAIKTKLVTHRDSLASQDDAITALDARIDAYDAKTFLRNHVVLTGSGNFTVPAGITALKVCLRGGGVNGVTLVHGQAGTSNTLWARGAISCVAGEEDVRILTVTPGDVIAYSVGINGVYTVPNATDTMFTETAATDTTFGVITAKCAQGVYEGGIGIANYPNRSLVAYTRDDYPANPAATRALLSGTAVKSPNALNLLTVTQYASPAAYITVEY